MCNQNETIQIQRQQGALQRERERQIALQQEMPTIKQNQTLEFHKYVLTPISSVSIEQELENGPPTDMSKAEKKAWKAQMATLLESAKTREAFYAPVHKMMDKTEARLYEVKEQGKTKISDYTDMMTELNQDTKLDMKHLTKDKQFYEKENIKGLLSIFDVLNKAKPGEIPREQMIELTQQYISLQGELGQTNATSADRLNEAVRLSNQHACYAFLLHSVVTMLSYYLNQLPVGSVNIPAFAKLHGLATATGAVAATLYMSREYQQLKDAYEQEQGRKALKEEQDRRELAEKIEARREYLRTGVTKEGKPDVWILGPYAEEVEKALGGIVTSSDHDMDYLISQVHAIENFVLQNRERIIEQLKGVAVTFPEVLLERVEKKYFLNMANMMPQDNLLTIVTEILDDNSEVIEKWRSRSEYLNSLEGMNQLYGLLELPFTREMLLEDCTELEFQVKAQHLSEQLVHNLSIVDSVVSERISGVNKEKVFNMLVKECETTLLNGTRDNLLAKVNHYLSETYLEQKMPEVVSVEKKVQDAMQISGLDNIWMEIGTRGLSVSDDTDTMVEKLAKVKKAITKNKRDFDELTGRKRFVKKVWEQIVEWRKENFILYPGFYYGLSRLIDSLIASTSNPPEEAVSYAEYEEGNRQAEQLQTTQEQNNVELLKGTQLCKWEGFSGLLQGYEDAVVKALDTVLEKKNLNHAFLKNINNTQDLNALNYGELEMLISRLRVNVGKALTEWKTLDGAYAEQIRINLLPELLSGTLQVDNFFEYARKELHRLERHEKAKEMRLSLILGSSEIQEPGKLLYQHLDNTDSTAIMSKDSRAKRRLERFETADKVWQVLEKHGLAKEMVQETIKIQGKNKENQNDAKSVKELHAVVLRLLQSVEDTEAKELYTSLKKDGMDSYINELPLCGMEEYLLSRENNAEAYRVFTSDFVKEYNEVLKQAGSFVIPRMQELMTVLENRCVSKREYEEYRTRMRPLLAGLKEGKEEENYKKYGVRSWEQALQELANHINKQHRGGDEEKESEIHLVEQRQKHLESYKDGILKPILPVLLKDEEFFGMIVTADYKYLAEYVDAVYAKMEIPLTIIKVRYSFGDEFKRQLIEELGNEIFYGEQKSRSEWTSLFDDYFDRFCGHLLGGTSIKQRHQKLIEKEPEIAAYFTEILLANKDGLGLLTDENKLQQTIMECKKCIQPNTQEMERFLQDKQIVNEAERVGFRMYIQSKIPFVAPEEFKMKLENWLAEFEELRFETFEKTMQTKELMSYRARMLMDVEEHRNAGILEDGEDMQILRRMQGQIRAVGSPLLAALGVKKMPGVKQFEEAKEKLSKFAQYPERVKNCLYERILSGAGAKTLEKEAQWLNSINSTIEELRISKDEAEELLMFIYCRQRGEELNKEQISEAHRLLGERHVLIGKMMDENFVRAAESRTKVWRPIIGYVERKNDSKWELKENPVLQKERHLVMEAMAAGIYTMEEKELKDFANRKAEYFRTAEILDGVFTELLDKNLWKEQEKQAAKIGLMEYFHGDIVKGRTSIDIDALRAKTERMLADPLYREHLISGVMMESVGHDSLSLQEKTLHTVANRETLEQLLKEKKNQEFCIAYNKLNVEQRQVFALSVLQEDYICELPSAKFVCSDELRENRQAVIMSQLEKYMAHEEFSPQISYDRVLDMLRLPNGSIDKAVFDKAMDNTETCIRRYQYNTTKDWLLLSDGANTIKEVNRIMDNPAKRKEIPEQVTDVAEFKERLLALDTKNEAAGAQKERLSKLDDYELQLLVTVLEDRTVVDYSTRLRKADEQPKFVNALKREDMKQSILREENELRMYTRKLTKAMTSLFSFQIRDDVEISRYRKLGRGDFADKALSRETTVDWGLLGRAIDFVGEISKA